MSLLTLLLTLLPRVCLGEIARLIWRNEILVRLKEEKEDEKGKDARLRNRVSPNTAYYY